jgi:hypothetical protein
VHLEDLAVPDNPADLVDLADTAADMAEDREVEDTGADILPTRLDVAVVGNFHSHRNTDCMTFLLL